MYVPPRNWRNPCDFLIQRDCQGLFGNYCSLLSDFTAAFLIICHIKLCSNEVAWRKINSGREAQLQKPVWRKPSCLSGAPLGGGVRVRQKGGVGPPNTGPHVLSMTETPSLPWYLPPPRATVVKISPQTYSWRFENRPRSSSDERVTPICPHPPWMSCYESEKLTLVQHGC